MIARSSSRWRSSRRIWWSRPSLFQGIARRSEATTAEARGGLLRSALSSGAHSRDPLLAMTVVARAAPLRTLPIHLRRQPLHRVRDVAPLRKPAARKAEGEVGAVDAAFGQAHAGRRRIARAARGQRGACGRIEILAAVGRVVAERRASSARPAALPRPGRDSADRSWLCAARATAHRDARRSTGRCGRSAASPHPRYRR